MNENMEDISVTYNTQYGIVDSTSVLTNATQALALNICGDYNVAMKEQVIRATLKDVDAPTVEKIILNLHSTDTAEEGLPSENLDTNIVDNDMIDGG